LSYYSSPYYYESGYYPYCDPAWGPCYYPPADYYGGYGRPGVAISVGVGRFGVRGVAVRAGWRHFSRR